MATAARIRELSGWHPFPGLPLPVIAWLQAERPEFTDARTALSRCGAIS